MNRPAPEPEPTPPIRVTGEPVTVTAATVADFARAVHAPADVPPPTLAAVLTDGVQQALLGHPDLRIDLSRTLHTEQSAVLHRPLRLGDVLTATAEVTGVRPTRGGRTIIFDTRITDDGGRAVQSLTTVLLTAAAEGEGQ